jgi:hypothetical protein
MRTYREGVERLMPRTTVKFIMTVGEDTFNILSAEATKADVSVQELLRSVIIRGWIQSDFDTPRGKR